MVAKCLWISSCKFVPTNNSSMTCLSYCYPNIPWTFFSFLWYPDDIFDFLLHYGSKNYRKNCKNRKCRLRKSDCSPRQLIWLVIFSKFLYFGSCHWRNLKLFLWMMLKPLIPSYLLNYEILHQKSVGFFF